MKSHTFWLLPLVLLLGGCSTVLISEQGPVLGVDGIPCVGEVVEPPVGLIEVEDNTLLQTVLKPSGEGMLCTGKVFEVMQAVTVYRVWDGAKAYTLYGGWWSLNLPQGPKERYREENDICPEWSELNRISQCQLKIGAKVVIGPGQSANCEDFTYAKSAVNQLYVPNDSRNNVLYVEGCSEGVEWPG